MRWLWLFVAGSGFHVAGSGCGQDALIPTCTPLACQ